MRLSLILPGLLLMLLQAAACSEVPELDAAVPAWVDDADYPAVVPLDSALAQAPLVPEQAADIEKDVSARVARLKARAAALNAPIVDGTARTRMESGTDS